MSETELLRQVQVVLPAYLTPTQQADLWSEIRRFPDNQNFYLPDGTLDEDLLQGDGWSGLIAVNIETLERRTVSGLLVSNSCDMDLRNPRALLPNVLFSPLIPIARLAERYRASGKSQKQLDSFLSSVRRQEKTNIFFLPEAPHGPEEESIVMLDNLHQESVRRFTESERSKIFRLNQFAFWTLLIKLSIHFSRFNEDVARYPTEKAS